MAPKRVAPSNAAKDAGTAERIAEAARKILAKEGPEAVSMRRIADIIGITPMAIYYHYANREALLQAIVFEELDRINTLAQRAADVEGGKVDWEAIGDGYLDYAFAHPHLFDYLFVARRKQAVRYPDGVRARKSPSLTPLADRVANAIKQGAFKRSDIWEVAIQLWAHAHGYATLYRAGWFEVSEDEFRALHRRAIKRLLHGLLKEK